MIRTLRPGELVPTGEPKRYPDRDGDVRLRWQVGPKLYVETRARRVVDGRVTTAKRTPPRSRLDVDEVVAAYNRGLSQPQIADLVGCDSTTVCRLLRRAGVSPRPVGTNQWTTPYP